MHYQSRKDGSVYFSSVSRILGGVKFMSTEVNGPGISLQAGLRQFPWYGIRTRSNHERAAAIALSGKGYDPYLPVYRLPRRADAVVESKILCFRSACFAV